MWLWCKLHIVVLFQIIEGTDEIKAYFYSYILSKKLGIQQNWEKALKLITHRFEETALSKEFAQLQLSYVREILSAPSIGARSEIIVFLAALNWLNHDFGRRITDSVGVMQCVHFSSMTMLEVIACYHPPILPQVVQIPDVISMLYRATCYIAAKSQGQENWFKQYASPKRILTLANLPMELWHYPSYAADIASDRWDVIGEQEKEKVKHWERTTQLIDRPAEMQSIIPKSQTDLLLNNLSDTYNEESGNESMMECEKDIHDQALVKNVNFKQESEEESYILIIGGMNPKNIKEEIGAGAAVTIYDHKVKKWLPYCNLPEPRHNHCTAMVDNILYVIGGCNPQETIEKNRSIATKSCYKLELKSKRWSRLPDMKCARFDHGLAAYYGQLYVVGGQDENDRLLNSVEVYDPFRNRWRLLYSTMCCGRKAMGVAVYGKRIWVAGGLIQSEEGNQWLAVSHVDCYSTTEKRWYFNTHLLPGPRCFCSLAVWNGKLYCIAGMIQVCDGETGPTDEVWFVGNENDLWGKGPSLPEPKMGGVALIHDHSLYFLGGFNPNCDSDIPKTYILRTGSTSWEEGPSLLSHLFGLSSISFTLK